ncbi:bifunctional hydroxymethylpyrimidine kinase/phosphomethylpyrimidine kinase [Anaerotruncus sp. 80]|uniref:Hydroxymethylpyrimidine/phosphomethylpyrimidine kinase n=1 Tax=Anaerotruncus colihominis TaxID=169435 RepID=A0A845QK14_9FIRM|nr:MULTISPECIES: bifunctional hydroxymethylpyrimidine kinase/phosphomethylpyrimidine kinase [Anaerotruncus]NBH62219.1 bifunctional hydroxymethylpyrimidine kinase/phosphomethylpyrimidine kinase [Anaerotruncus colihominis]NCF02874.1 bifunctional hydroxymethylpyrimidine kinase/phosphomethylpyrimidine kinase [Anaerotruncus sp. 80]
MKKFTALTIAGSDCSGGAGIQADIKTMTMNGVYAMSAVTALTAQNTTGVRDVMDITPAFLAAQLDAIFTDIYPDGIKIGMVSSAALVDVIAEKLTLYKAKHIVLDPVMVASSGAKLLSDEGIKALCEQLMPLAELVTPNIPEAEFLCGRKIKTQKDMEAAAQTIKEKFGCNVLLKGGHQTGEPNDFLLDKDGSRWFYGERIDNPNTHGTGCTLSSAIAAGLAKGLELEVAVEQAKKYISEALSAMLDLGAGSGPMDHAYWV